MTTPQAFVSTRDYRDWNGFGTSNYEEIDNLKKALFAGNDINAPAVAPGVGFPLRPESLESTLKNVTYEMEHIQFWKHIDKLPGGYHTIKEHAQVRAFARFEGVEDYGDIRWMDLSKEVLAPLGVETNVVPIKPPRSWLSRLFRRA